MPNGSSCGAPILWGKTQAGKAMPVDAEPTPDGNIVLADQPRRKSHFATCPAARRHRKP